LQQELPPLSLYVHLPWCIKKCPYCDFNSHAADGDPPRERYLGALIEDLRSEARSGRAAGRALQSLFLGGGTPSLFSAAEIGRIIAAAHDTIGVADAAEITMEANPGTLEHGELGGYRAAGVTRLSLGAQSFNAESLARLGRIHGPHEIVSAFRAAERAGFESVNLDLMFGLPGQDLKLARSDLAAAIDLGAAHVSWYQLTLEPNTVFYARPPADLPDDEQCWEMQAMGHDMLGSAGYEHYEVSAFAQEGHCCLHNLNYWRFGDYLGVGAGAHGKFTTLKGAIWRYEKPAHPLAYIERQQANRAPDPARSLSNADIGFEFMLNALRLTAGFDEATFRTHTGLEPADVAAGLERAAARGMLERVAHGWRPTRQGLRFLNDLQAQFLPSA
jgi:oxygen-independent coproporphyrinogen-3 oxidase